jgi:hypothetical protein
VIRLRNTILIHAPPERVWAWLDDLPSHYRDWHPAHLTCRYERGQHLEAGAVLYTEELLHHRLHRLRLRATEVVAGRAVHYRGRGFTGAFLLEPVNGSTAFTAELAFGMRPGVLGDLLDWLLRRLLAGRLAALRTHLHEEGINLKRLVEEQHA